MSYFKLIINQVKEEDGVYFVRTDDVVPPKKTYFDKSKIEPIVCDIRKRNGFWDISDYDEKCRQVGYTIFSSFFVGSIRDKYESYERGRLSQGKSPSIKLYIPNDLHWLPWELLRKHLSGDDDDTYIALNGSIIRYIYAQDEQIIIKDVHETTGPQLVLLYVYASPKNIDVQVREPRFDISNEYVHMIPKQPARSFREFERLIGQYAPDGLLFHGHAIRTQDHVGVLIFELDDGRKDEIKARDIGRLTKDWKTKIAILSACDTASFFSDMPFRDSIVGQIIRLGYPSFVIAYQNEIEQLAACSFVTNLIGFIGNHSLLQCMKVGRTAIRSLEREMNLRNQRASRDWWLPVLYASTENPDIIIPSREQSPIPYMGKREEETAESSEILYELLGVFSKLIPNLSVPQSIKRSKEIMKTEDKNVPIIH